MCGYHPLFFPLTVVTLWSPPSCGYPVWLPAFHGDSMVSSLHAELFFLCWFICGFLDTTWCPCQNHVVSTFESMWCPPGNHIVYTWKPHGIHIETMWCPCGNHIVSSWKPHGVHMETMFCPYINNVIFTWKSYGVHI